MNAQSTEPQTGSQDSTQDSTQVLVIGGGPAGSTAAALLAKQGVSVTVLESAVFPRYHIGESILPSALPILELSGARKQVEEYGFVKKVGAYFEWGPENWDLNFDHLSGSDRHSYQVVRSEFDHILLRNAADAGATVHEGRRVVAVDFEDGRPRRAHWRATGTSEATDSVGGTDSAGTDAATGIVEGSISFDYVIDASGRAGVLSTKYLDNRVYHEAFRNVALWGYWEGVTPLDVGPEGAIAVCSVPYGWFWAIPLHDGTTSVGLVIKKSALQQERDRLGSNEAVYADAISQCARIRTMVATGTQVTPLKIEQDYSYAADRFDGPGYLLAGDAACFLDPLLSTGVHLATFSGLLAAASLSAVIDGDLPEQEARNFYTQAYHQAYERLLVVVSFFYNSYNRQTQFFEADKLTRRERHMLNLYESFLHIVTGVEDLQDTRDGGTALDAVANRLAQSGELVAGHNEAMNSLPNSPQTSVGGLYLELEPRLRLRRVGEAALADAASA